MCRVASGSSLWVSDSEARWYLRRVRWRLAIVLLASCGHGPIAQVDAGPSEICLKERALRDAAADLEKQGHDLSARAKLDEANAACPGERAATSALEAKVLAYVGDCAAAFAVPGDAGAEPKTLCDDRTAPSAGTEATMRAKTRQAFTAQHAKDFTRAKALYLEAWKELHPNPIALEAAGRMAARAGDAAEGRRLRDRALWEAESSEHATAILTNRVRAHAGYGRLVDGTLVIARDGRVVARDLATGELRALLDGPTTPTLLSQLGTLAMTHKSVPNEERSEVVVYDLLTRSPLLGGEKLAEAIASPDDKLLLARSRNGTARIIDVETGGVRATLDGDVFPKLNVFGFDSKGRLLVAKGDGDSLRDWDVEKNAFGSFAVPAHNSYVGFSPTGRYMATFPPSSISSPFDDFPLEVRDLETGKLISTWTGRFEPVHSFGITPDGAILATGSNNSVRLWTIADHKHIFSAERTRRGDNFDYDLGEWAISDDGKSVVLGRGDRTMLWDVATGKETLAVSNQRHDDVLGVTPLPGGGMVVVAAYEVRVVPRTGDVRVICPGYEQHYYPDVGPTSVALSPSGKLLACAMNAGAIHVFDTSTWEERARIDGPSPGKTKGSLMASFEWDGVPPSARPVDLAFTADDATLTVVTHEALLTYDAHTGKAASKVALRDPKLALVRRHVRLPDGRIVVKTSSGSGALFDASGQYSGSLALVAGAPLSSPDAFSADGKTYAIAVGKALHRIDTDSGADRTTDLPDAPVALAISPDGKACVVVATNGTVQQVGDAPKKLETRLPAKRAFFVNRALVVVTGSGDTLELFGEKDASQELEVDPNGLIARGRHGTFEVRGRAEAECAVGKIDLTEETCADRAEEGLLAAWMTSLR